MACRSRARAVFPRSATDTGGEHQAALVNDTKGLLPSLTKAKDEEDAAAKDKLDAPRKAPCWASTRRSRVRTSGVMARRRTRRSRARRR